MATTLTLSSREQPIDLTSDDSRSPRAIYTLVPPGRNVSLKRGPHSPDDAARKRPRVASYGGPNNARPVAHEAIEDGQLPGLIQRASPPQPQPSPAVPAARAPSHRPGTPPSTSRKQSSTASQASPENYRLKARAEEFRSRGGKSDGVAAARSRGRNAWYNHDGHRPYLDCESRERVAEALYERMSGLARSTLQEPRVYHVDFDYDEIEFLRQEARKLVPLSKPPRDGLKELSKILKKNPGVAKVLPEQLKATGALYLRDEFDIYYFLTDINKQKVSKEPETLSLQRGGVADAPSRREVARVANLIYRGEMEGFTKPGIMRGALNVRREIQTSTQDTLELRMQWTDGPGDIITISWVSNDNFICGTTVHMDSHNQQYNKPGNLLLCSTRAGTVKAFPDHRIPRPVVGRGENSTSEMRQSQSPWLYPSVVSSDYCKERDIAFTSSFDGTVKIWKVPGEGGTMDLLGTWAHRGNVNFVVVSTHASRLVATAADVSVDSVRVYNLDSGDVSASPYTAFGHRIGGPACQPLESDRWAYFPATIQWGLAEGCQHHLLVGYSPRSVSTDDNDIPEDKRNTGVMRLWNALSGSEVGLSITMMQNVFEVAWHPTRPVFVVATSVAKTHAEHKVLTQIRVFALSTNTSEIQRFRSENYALAQNFSVSEFYASMQILDCYSSDINEITIKPNSHECSYVTAATTDGKVYVWDTAQGDQPIHILQHGDPVEEFNGDREKEDVGVKFTAWGRTLDRFYTGGSDGFVKVWNVRHAKPLARNLLEVTGPVSFGAFSLDYSKLAVGDASGRIFLLTDDKDDDGFYDSLSEFVKLPGGVRRRKPKPIQLHPEPAPPAGNEAEPGAAIGRKLLQTWKLRRHKYPALGVFQGPNYHQLGLYRKEAHWDMDPAKGLKADFERVQQKNRRLPRSYRMPRPTQLPAAPSREQQQRNDLIDDMNDLRLDPETRADLEAEGAELEPDYGFQYESGREFSDSGESAESASEYESDGDDEVDYVGASFYADFEDDGRGFVEEPYLSERQENSDDESSSDDTVDEIPAGHGSSTDGPNGPMSHLNRNRNLPAIPQPTFRQDRVESESESDSDSNGDDGRTIRPAQNQKAREDDEMSVRSESSVKDVFTKPGPKMPLVHDDSADEDYEDGSGGYSDGESNGESDGD